MKLRIPLKKKIRSVVVDTLRDTVVDTSYDSLNVQSSLTQEVYEIAVMIPFFFDENNARMRNVHLLEIVQFIRAH